MKIMGGDSNDEDIEDGDKEDCETATGRLSGEIHSRGVEVEVFNLRL